MGAASEGLCFSDGRRKVDYVLVFHQPRHSSIRCPAGTSVSQDRLSIVSNGNFPPSAGSDAAAGRGGGGGLPGGEAASVGEVFVELGGAGGDELTEPADREMRLIRQEFEANLREAGLEIERDREVSVHVGPYQCPCPHIFYFLMLDYDVVMQLRVMVKLLKALWKTPDKT